MSYRDAVVAALLPDIEVETRWSGALHETAAYELSDREGLMREVRTLEVDASSGRIFSAFTSLGGDRGLANGSRTTSEIRDALSAIYGPVPQEAVDDFLAAAAGAGLLSKVR